MLDNFLYAEKTEENVLLATMESAEIKLDRLLNTYCLMEENFEVSLREAELKCFEESGDMDDLEQYYTEAQEKANEQEKGILGRIWDAIVKFARRIKEFFFGKKSSVKPEDEVEAPKGFIGAVKKGCKFIKTLGSNIIGWVSKHKGAVLAGGAAVGAIAIFLNKDKLKEKLKSKDKEKVKGKDIQETLKECGEAAEVVGEAAQKQSEKPAASSSGGEKKEETKKESEVDAETPKTLKNILSGIQYTGKAVESLATGANIASTKANLTGAKNNNSSLGTSVNTKNGTKGNHGTFDQNGIEWIDTDDEKPKNEKNEKKAEKKEEKKDKTKGNTNTTTNTNGKKPKEQKNQNSNDQNTKRGKLKDTKGVTTERFSKFDLKEARDLIKNGEPLYEGMDIKKIRSTFEKKYVKNGNFTNKYLAAAFLEDNLMYNGNKLVILRNY